MSNPFHKVADTQNSAGVAADGTRIAGGPCAAVLPPRKRPRQQRSVATVSAIMEAAARILEEGGRLNTNTIAERAGVGIATLYQYFDSKEAILAALSRDTRGALVQRVKDSIAAACQAPLESGFRFIVEAALEGDRSRPALAVALDSAEAALPLDADEAQVRTELGQALAEFLSHHGAAGDGAKLILADDLCAMAASLIEAARARGTPTDAHLVDHVTMRLLPIILHEIGKG